MLLGFSSSGFMVCLAFFFGLSFSSSGLAGSSVSSWVSNYGLIILLLEGNIFKDSKGSNNNKKESVWLRWVPMGIK
jgi:hypothetical protein